MKTSLMLIFGIFISNSVFCQDTSQNQQLSHNQTYQVVPPNNQVTQPQISAKADLMLGTDTQNHIYRDTRLGSSSPLYNTYEKNNYGAGAVTTNPNKNGGGNYTPPAPMTTRTDTSFSNVPRYDSLGNIVNKSDSVNTNPNKQ